MTHLPPDALRSILEAGRHMARDRYQRGRVEAVGSTVKKWRGHYYLYERLADGSEVRRHKTVTLGLRAKLSKGDAARKLQETIDRETKQPQAVYPEMTVAEFWRTRFKPLWEPRWKENTRKLTVYSIERYVIARIGLLRLCDVDRFALQTVANDLAAKYSRSVVHKFIVYARAIFEEAVDQEVIVRSPARKLEIPETARRRQTRLLSLDEIRALIDAAHGRDRIILRILMLCGLRPGELFALRRNDFIGDQLRIDETVADSGATVDPKTEESAAFVCLPASLATEIRFHVEHLADQAPDAFLFPSRTGGPMAVKNYLRRDLRAIAENARAKRMNELREEPPASWLADVTHQMFRRSCATYLHQYASARDLQGHMRHASPVTSLTYYAREIPATVRAAVEELDASLGRATAENAAARPN